MKNKIYKNITEMVDDDYINRKEYLEKNKDKYRYMFKMDYIGEKIIGFGNY